jgi:hypothetical protein
MPFLVLLSDDVGINFILFWLEFLWTSSIKRGNFFYFSVDERLSSISFHYSVDERCNWGPQLMQLGPPINFFYFFYLIFFNHIHFKQKSKTFILRTIRQYA